MMFSVDSNAEEKEEIDVTDEEKGDDDGVDMVHEDFKIYVSQIRYYAVVVL